MLETVIEILMGNIDKVVTASSIIMVVALIMIVAFEKLDTTSREEVVGITNLTIKDIIKIVIVAVTCGIAQAIFVDNMVELVVTDVLLGVLIQLAYTDQKTKTVHAFIPVVLLMVEMVYIVFNAEDIGMTIKKTVLALLIITLFMVLSLIGELGFGDVLIFAVMQLYFIIIVNEYCIVAMYLTSIITYVMFVLVNVFRMIKDSIYKYLNRGDGGKKLTETRPLTVFIVVSYFVISTAMLSIN